MLSLLVSLSRCCVREQEPCFSCLGRRRLELASGFPHCIFYRSGSLHRRAGLEFVLLFYHLAQSLLTDSGQFTCRKATATHTPALIRFHWRFVFPAFRSSRASGLVLPLGCFFSFLRESVSQDKISILCFPFVQECALVFSLTGARQGTPLPVVVADCLLSFSVASDFRSPV
jgi:hypothetical protein